METLEQQSRTRVPELVPLRYSRMLASPFAFFRGAAAIMARDLAPTPATGFRAQLCGDAHLSNFGGFAAPDRRLVFDVNDFDESLPGPWEWDVKRLAASFAVAGRERGFNRKHRRASVLAAVGTYRESMREFAAMRTIDVWYARLDLTDRFESWARQAKKSRRKGVEKAFAKAWAKDSLRALSKLTHEVDGEPRIISDPPLIMPIADLVDGDERQQLEQELIAIVHGYRDTLPGDRRHLLDGYRVVDLAHKVVGVGSVGTRAWIVLLLGRDATDPLFLQVKEAEASVLAPFAGPTEFTTQGQRVVEGQRLMQAASDVFLGWFRAPAGIDSRPHDYYVRQLWDAKASVPIDALPPKEMNVYGQACGWTLARAHARSGDRAAIAAYLGKSDRFDHALADFAEAYADQNELDYAALAAAVESGAVNATRPANRRRRPATRSAAT